MADSAALLVDEILPYQPMRQWVLSVPFPLRFLFTSNPKAMTGVLGIVYRAISTHLTQKAGLKKPMAQTGAVTLVQRFGSALNLNIHFHMIFLDGVYTGGSNGLPIWFRQVKAPNRAELTRLTHTIARGLDYIRQIRKTPIFVNDSPGFYTSRVFSTATNEGMTMLAEGVNPALIENAAKMAGLPVGPLAVMDEVTLELGYRITMQAAADQGDDYDFESGFPVMKKFVEELDRKGKRYGGGFYEYPEEGKKHLWPGLAEIYPVMAEQPPVQEVIDRLLYRQALESARCFEEGVLDHPADADIGSIFGWGFPAWAGGTLSFIDTVGIRRFVHECDRMTKAYGARFAVSDWLRQRAENGESFHP